MDVNPAIWSPAHIALLKAAAQDKEVERVLVNPAIKKALCRDVKGDRSWLHKMRPVFGHNYHFHVRIGCPKDERRLQGPGRAAGRRRLRQGSRLVVQKRSAHRQARRTREPMKMSALPAACRQVLLAE